ncbi:unnamed protein product [Rotaria sordida]|uniref:Uncharacterized protein n=1 Tax=Rotaria sordida TaxID=392033 RepID=A0A819SC47_9BILA|nr:unnamed protein product [Rotaria sordida]CAF4054201.1 unnamed protein product [Rotaria sordida]
MAYGSVFWGAGVMAVRYGGPHLFRTNLSRSLTMAATVPTAHVLVRITEAIFSLNSQERLAALTLSSGIALILDGVAHTWFPSAYENPSLQKIDPLAACSISRYGSGWLLFFVGILLTMLVFT